MDFDEACKAVTQRLEKLYADARESPKVLGYGFDTGESWAPMVDWRGVMGVYIHLVDKATGDLTPLSFPQFADMPDPERVGSWPAEGSNSRLLVVTARVRTRLREGVPLAHPGHADQKSHGRRRGLRSDLAKAKTVEQVAAVVAARAEKLTGHKVDVDFAGSDLEMARQHGEGVLRGFERFPKAPLTQVTTYGPGSRDSDIARQAEQDAPDAFAVTLSGAGGPTIDLPGGKWTTGSALAFNNAHSNQPDYQERLTRMRTEGFSVVSTPQGVALHEFGHAVSQHGRPSAPQFAVAEHVRGKAQAAGTSEKAFISASVSRYASSSSAELAGEVVADVMLHGSKASAVSRSAFDVLVTNHEGYVAEMYGPTTSNRLPALVALSRDRLLNHPGHSSQKSHGRKGGVRDALAKARTDDEVSDAAEAEAKRITGRDIRFDFAGSDVELAKEHAEGILRGLERYPDAPLERVHQGGDDFGEARELWAMTRPADGTITFTDHAQRRGPDAYREALKQAKAEGDIVAGTPTGVALHEFGHIVAEGRGAAGTAAAASAARSAAPPLTWIPRHVGSQVSNYATESDSELAAEAFADVMHNGSSASATSRAIVDAVDEAYAAAGGGE